MNRQPNHLIISLLLSLLLAVPSCAGLFDLSESRERRIGEEMMRELKKQYDYYTDWEITGIGQLLRAASERPDRVADFHVLPDPQVNAFAMPGGHVMITEGLLETMNSEDEIAFVLAHEIGHCVKRHIAAEYKRANENGMLFAVILGALGAGRGWWDAGNLLQNITLNQYSQKKEREADRIGYELTAKSGFSPEAAISALEKLRQQGEEGSKTMNKLFGTHPLIAERVHRLDFAPPKRTPERPVIEPPLDSLAKTKLLFEYLNHDDEPWTDAWAVAIANRVTMGLNQVPNIALVRKWQLRRAVDQPDYKVIVHRRLVKKGRHQDATLEVDIQDLTTDTPVWNKLYATRPISARQARVESFADEVSGDIARFLHAARQFNPPGSAGRN